MKKEPANLQHMWDSFAKDVAVAFLRRVVHPHMSLRQLGQALSFPRIRPHLAELRLQQVVGSLLPQLSTAANAPAASAAAAAAPRPLAPPRRAPAPQGAPASLGTARRRQQDTRQIEQLVVAALGRQDAAVPTPQLALQVAKDAPGCAAHTVATVLRNMERQGVVTADHSRPRAWQLKPQGRRSAEPLIIRKAAALAPPAAPVVQPAPPAPPAADSTAAPSSVALMSQAEVQLAAEQLRKKFFAPSKTG